MFLKVWPDRGVNPGSFDFCRLSLHSAAEPQRLPITRLYLFNEIHFVIPVVSRVPRYTILHLYSEIHFVIPVVSGGAQDCIYSMKYIL
jgi:hypothetical protein